MTVINSIQLESTFELLENVNVAEASVSLNPSFRWAKFTLTDDLPNKNKKRIPVEEFENLIRTGLYAPIKMAKAEIKNGHENALPLGTITALKQEGNTIVGLAALWSLERPEDVELVHTYAKEKKPLNLSWEILYEEAQEEENGVSALRGTLLRATTLVGLPAYGGRTPILQVASMEGTLPMEDLQAQLTELQTKLDESLVSISALTTEIETLKTEKESLTSEKEVLSQFKASIEQEQVLAEKISVIKSKFSESGITKPEDYFSTNREMLLGLSESALDFMLQEMVAFSSKSEQASTKIEIPVISDNKKIYANVTELAKELRKL